MTSKPTLTIPGYGGRIGDDTAEATPACPELQSNTPKMSAAEPDTLSDGQTSPCLQVGNRMPATTVTVYPDGPLVIRGDFQIRDVNGNETPTSRIAALCRCGRSTLKPLCDGSHNQSRRRPQPTPRLADDEV
jgi:CDGSH-type Zn-finger protein